MANASSSTHLPPVSPSANPTPVLHKPVLVHPDEDSSQSEDGEEPLDIDQDDVQSIIQPALSPVATRLTSPKTPAAEKAAAMENLSGGGLFSVMEDPTSPDSGYPPSSSSVRHPAGRSSRAPVATVKARARQNRGFSLGQMPQSLPQLTKFPSPWTSGPKELVDSEPSPKPALSGVFSQSRHRRSSSGGTDALKRIREALPSISLPSFFSGPSTASSPRSPESDTRKPIVSSDGAAESKPARFPTRSLTARVDQATNRNMEPSSPDPARDTPTTSRPPTTGPARPRMIRRSTSDESMLYHSLSRVSSFGDDNRWDNIREQKNVRFKAITDSWDVPTFKLPQLPNILPAPLKNFSLGPDLSDASLNDAARPATIPETGQDGGLSDLDRALSSLTGDIVVMGGYRGSILRSTKTNRQVWVPVKLGLNFRKVNLEVGLNPEDDVNMEESIYASGMLQNIGPVDISKRLFKRLRECENAKSGKLRVWDYGYDWRLNPHLLSRKLIAFLEQLPSNQPGENPGSRGAMVIAHSLGGLITRHALNQRPELFSGVVYAGTPQRCVNILGPFRNGDAVLFNEKVLTAQVNFSLRTSFVFLPEDGFCFINKHTGEEYRIDFHDPQEWAKYALSPCIEPSLPAYNSRSTALGSFLELSGKLPTPLRSRGNSNASDPRQPQSPTRNLIAEATRKAEVAHDHTLAPQMGTLQADQPAAQQQQKHQDTSTRSRNMAYLSRVLADVKRFRAETFHRPEHTEANLYPPLAVIYGKDIPTVWAAHVSSRDAIPCADAYDDLVFRSGDGVVLAREAQLPEGYELVKGGRISTDRGHITMLGDLEAVGRAIQAVIRGRRKGIGLGRRIPAGIKDASQQEPDETPAS
ncbi:hypothetical protein F4775DRAFT_554981 [Biscogniauxia sp. FL1348]|nr:hypothetical protein F4775DRAFT_554981 [Biscogniauxia sp. FL1348]